MLYFEKDSTVLIKKLIFLDKQKQLSYNSKHFQHLEAMPYQTFFSSYEMIL